MLDLHKLRAFYYVAQEGSFSKAAPYMGMQVTSMSKVIAQLEHELGIKIFRRHYRGVDLTEDGTKLLRSAVKIFEEVEYIYDSMRRVGHGPRGMMRVLTTRGVSMIWLIDKVCTFLAENPHMHVRVVGTDERINLASDYMADAAFTPLTDTTSDHIARKVLSMDFRLYASPGYLKKFGTPKKLEDLSQHRLLSFYHEETRHRGNVDWHLRAGMPQHQTRRPYMVINSSDGLLEAATRDAGIITNLKENPFLQRCGLVEILADAERPTVDVFYVYPRKSSRLARVVALGDYLIKVRREELKAQGIELEEEGEGGK